MPMLFSRFSFVLLFALTGKKIHCDFAFIQLLFLYGRAHSSRVQDERMRVSPSHVAENGSKMGIRLIILNYFQKVGLVDRKTSDFERLNAFNMLGNAFSSGNRRM